MDIDLFYRSSICINFNIENYDNGLIVEKSVDNGIWLIFL